MDYVEIFDKISELKLDYNYDINAGGCGCFAAIVVEIFPDLKIFYKYPETYNIERNIPSSCSHVILSDGKNYYDSNGIYELRTKSVCRVSLDYLKKSLEVAHWNNEFDRRNLPIIIEKIHKAVGKYAAKKPNRIRITLSERFKFSLRTLNRRVALRFAK